MKQLSLSLLALTLLMPNSSLAAFSDTAGHLYEPEIASLESLGIVGGYADGTYKPDQTINRAEFTKIVIGARYTDSEIMDLLARATVIPFSDIPNGAWYADYVFFAQASGIIGGYPDGTFRPAQNVNYAEAAKIVSLAFTVNPVGSDDVWYEPYTKALVMENAAPQTVTQPDAFVTRGEMAYIIETLVTNKQIVQDQEETDDADDAEDSEESEDAEEEEAQEEEKAAEESTEDDSTESDSEDSVQSGVYTSFTDDVIGNGQSSVLFFNANWCPSCKKHDDSLRDWYFNESFPVSVYKVNYDNADELKQRYGVTTQDTFVVIDSNGDKVELESFPSEEKLRELIEG